MIDGLDAVLRDILLPAFPVATGGPVPDEGWIRFQPPDDDWRKYVSPLGHDALNVYLVDLREDRRRRTNDRMRTYTDLGAVERPAPRWLTCHYLLTAWTSASPSTSVDPTPGEQLLLYRAAALLMNAEPLTLSRLFLPGGVPPELPEGYAGAELPLTVLPVDGFPKYAEFWGTMGQTHPWKPAVYFTVDLPVVLTERFAGPMITTRTIEYRQAGDPASARVLVQIGGQVTAGGAGIAGARVSLDDPAGPVDATTTDALGRFTFTRLSAGSYTLRANAAGYGETVRPLDIPSPTGEYDLELGRPGEPPEPEPGPKATQKGGAR